MSFQCLTSAEIKFQHRGILTSVRDLNSSVLKGIWWMPWQSEAMKDVAGFLDFQNHQNGGAMRDRTADLLNANQALSQLSYSPIFLVNGGPG